MRVEQRSSGVPSYNATRPTTPMRVTARYPRGSELGLLSRNGGVPRPRELYQQVTCQIDPLKLAGRVFGIGVPIWVQALGPSLVRLLDLPGRIKRAHPEENSGLVDRAWDFWARVADARVPATRPRRRAAASISRARPGGRIRRARRSLRRRIGLRPWRRPWRRRGWRGWRGWRHPPWRRRWDPTWGRRRAPGWVVGRVARGRSGCVTRGRRRRADLGREREYGWLALIESHQALSLSPIDRHGLYRDISLSAAHPARKLAMVAAAQDNRAVPDCVPGRSRFRSQPFRYVGGGPPKPNDGPAWFRAAVSDRIGDAP